MKKIIPFLTISVVFLTGCSTRYHSQGFAGGYSEIQTNPDSFIVSFKGNGYTSNEKVTKYVLLRASELTIKVSLRKGSETIFYSRAVVMGFGRWILKGLDYFELIRFEDHLMRIKKIGSDTEAEDEVNVVC